MKLGHTHPCSAVSLWRPSHLAYRLYFGVYCILLFGLFFFSLYHSVLLECAQCQQMRICNIRIRGLDVKSDQN